MSNNYVNTIFHLQSHDLHPLQEKTFHPFSLALNFFADFEVMKQKQFLVFGIYFFR